MTGAVSAQQVRNAARLRHRLLSLVYESLLLTAVISATALPIVMLTSSWHPSVSRAVLQIAMVVVCGVYFVWQWTRTGQTLAMKTWRLRLVSRDGKLLSPAHASLRYLLALAGTLTFGAGFLWALVDRDRAFLHDRLTGTLIIRTSD